MSKKKTLKKEIEKILNNSIGDSLVLQEEYDLAVYKLMELFEDQPRPQECSCHCHGHKDCWEIKHHQLKCEHCYSGELDCYCQPQRRVLSN